MRMSSKKLRCNAFAARATNAVALSALLLGGGCARAAEKKPNISAAKKARASGTANNSKATSSSANLRASIGARTPLDDYVARPEPLYRWRKLPRNAGDDAAQQPLELSSQSWQGATWTHRVTIFRPKKNLFPDTAIIYATGGETMDATDVFIGKLIADATGTTFVNLLGIPKQPLWSFSEDALIAYTFERYLQTGDATWPLLFPMTKSVVKTMDAMSEYSRREKMTPIRRFVITGASKRGWTTWLAGAVDKRVIGIAPIVYDNLNLSAQMPRQLETWGDYSVMIQDYTRRGLQAQMTTPRGQQLSAMVDPWTYRNRLTMPKLIINGTNDPYWTLGALNLYLGDLRGPTNILYVPNGGHNLGGLQGAQFAMQNMTGWFRRVASGKKVPTVELSSAVAATEKSETAPTTSSAPAKPEGSTLPIENRLRRFIVTTNAVRPGEKVTSAKLWVARSATRDFRKARWRSTAMTRQLNGTWSATAPLVSADDMKHAAAFAEIELAPNASSPLPTSLSTPIEEWEMRD